MAQLPCSGLSWPHTNPLFGSCAIYFHYGVYLPAFCKGNVAELLTETLQGRQALMHHNGDTNDDNHTFRLKSISSVVFGWVGWFKEAPQTSLSCGDEV